MIKAMADDHGSAIKSNPNIDNYLICLFNGLNKVSGAIFYNFEPNYLFSKRELV